MRFSHTALAVFITALWGFNFIAGKWAVAHFPPLFTAGMRMALLAVILVPFAKVPRGYFRQLGFLSFVFGLVHFGLLFAGMRYGGDVSTIVVIVQLNVPFAALLAWWFLGEAPGLWRMVAVVLSFAGVVIMSFDPGVFDYMLGVVLSIGAAAAMSAATVQMRALRSLTVFQLQGYMGLLAVPQLMLVSWMLETGQGAAVMTADLKVWLSVLYVAVGSSVLAHGGWYFLLRRYPVAYVNPFILLVPVFGVVFGVTIMDDEITLRMGLGAAVTLIGVAAIIWRQLVQQQRQEVDV